MSRNRSLLTSEVRNEVRLLLLSRPSNAKTDGIFSALNRVKTYSTSALMLAHVQNNILDNINLADAANEFVDRQDSRSKTFRHFSQNHS